MYKGTIVENSLRDKTILEQINVIKKYKLEDWVLGDILIEGKQISELQNCLAEGPWYVHLWEQGKDDVKVVFKNKIFDIKFSDKSTWTDAITYGISIGVPKEQLDFLID